MVKQSSVKQIKYIHIIHILETCIPYLQLLVPSTSVSFVDIKYYRKHISSYTARSLISEEDSNVPNASIKQLRKVVMIAITHLFILARNSNVQRVTIRPLRKETL